MMVQNFTVQKVGARGCMDHAPGLLIIEPHFSYKDTTRPSEVSPLAILAAEAEAGQQFQIIRDGFTQSSAPDCGYTPHNFIYVKRSMVETETLYRGEKFACSVPVYDKDVPLMAGSRFNQNSQI